MWKTIREAIESRTLFARLCTILVLLIVLMRSTR